MPAVDAVKVIFRWYAGAPAELSSALAADRMWSTAARVALKAVRRLTSSTKSQTSSPIVWNILSRVMPALLTRMSSFPKPSTAPATSEAAPSMATALSRLSAAVPPSAVISATTASAGSGSTSLTTTAAPSAANSLAVAAPIPRPAPVTMATRSSRRPTRRLARFPVDPVAAAPAAVLLHLQPALLLLAVLGRDVVAPLALGAGEDDVGTLVGCGGHWISGLLLVDLDDPAGANGPATLTDGEPEAFLHGDGLDQLDVDGRVVPGHDHLGALGELDRPGHVRGPEVELRAVVVEERRVPASLLLGEHVDLPIEHRVGGDGAWLRQDLPTLDVVLGDPSQQDRGVVTGLRLVEQL